MDYEKAYKEALERAKAGKPLDEVFSELKESEDERIRKSLVEYFRKFTPGNMWDEMFSFGDVVSYLEKQKEQRPTPKFKIGDVVRDTNHNRHPVYRIVSMDGECYICESDDQSLGDRTVVHFTLDNPYLRLVEQKPVEWSEEDELMRTVIIQTLERFGGRGTTEMQIDWLKSLRPQPHWKPSEEQMEALKDAVKLYKETHFERFHTRIESLYEQLKSL